MILVKKLKLYFLVILFFVSNYSFTQILQNWLPKTSMPTARKEIADAATTLNDKIYVLGGRTISNTITNVFEVYDSTTNSWSTLAPYPISVWRTSLEALDGKIYAMGGYQSINPFPFNPTNQAFCYDPNTNVWSPIQNMLSTRASASSVILNGEIHLIGGANNNALNTHHVYNPTTNNWSILASMNQNRSGLTAALIDNKIYAIGGYFLSGGLISLNSAEVYNNATNTWSSIANMPFTKLGITSAVVQNKIFVFGNENNTNVLLYDPLIDNWEELDSMPENVNFAGAVSLNGEIYVIGGGEINLFADGISNVNCFSPFVLSVNEYTLKNNFIKPSIGTTFYLNEINLGKINQIAIYNVFGVLINKIKVDSNFYFDAKNLVNGVYFVVANDNGRKISQKIIVKN